MGGEHGYLLLIGILYAIHVLEAYTGKYRELFCRVIMVLIACMYIFAWLNLVLNAHEIEVPKGVIIEPHSAPKWIKA